MEGAAATAFALARWPVAIAVMLVAVAFLYWAAPNAKLPFRWISPGALLATVGWIAMTFGFGIYVSNFGSYNATYGTLGGVVVTLIWFYLSGFVLLLGAELNAVLADEALARESPPALADSAEAPPAYQREAR